MYRIFSSVLLHKGARSFARFPNLSGTHWQRLQPTLIPVLYKPALRRYPSSLVHHFPPVNSFKRVLTCYQLQNKVNPFNQRSKILAAMDEWVDVEKSIDGMLSDRTIKASRSSHVSVNFYAAIEQAAQRRLKESKSPVFRVDLGEEAVYTTFLKNLAPELKQEYTCSSCRRFANRYGNLAMIHNDGTLQPLLWCPTDLSSRKMADTYMKAVRAIAKRFLDAKVTREFKIVSKNKSIGTPKTGDYSHMRLQFPESRVRKEQLSGFTSADTPELAAMLERVLAEYDFTTIRKADTLLHENKLPYADNHKASSRWLLELVEEDKMGKAKSVNARHNLLYRYAASSFIGSLKQMRSGALGTLLEDVQRNKSWDSILASWRKICDPTWYMRPQAAPAQGNINAAERLFTQLGLTKDDLTRRLLVQDDVPEEVVIWSSEIMKDRKKIKTTNSVFDAVKAKMKSGTTIPPDDFPSTTISFSQFVNKILPKARRLECWLGAKDTICTFITGLEGNKPLMQWHDDEGKNQASHYNWTFPPRVESHNLRSHAWNEVRCLIPFPNLWDGTPVTTTFPLADPEGDGADKYKYYHKSKGFRYLFVLEENHESRLQVTPLFPELLKSEFHGVRSTIEAFTRTEPLRDVKDGMLKGGFVAGVEAARSKKDQELKMRVHAYHGGTTTYKITLFE